MSVPLIGAAVPTQGETTTSLVGRDREVDRLDDLLNVVGRGARFVVVRGEAGIGKTALWRVAVERSRRAGFVTLVTRAAEEELAGPVVGLVDLFDGCHPVEGALATDAGLYDRGRAVLATLRTLAADSPVLVAIDDVQWLDPVSAGALRYALRRLEGEPIIVLATERVDATSAPDDRTLPHDRREEIFVGPLTLDEIRAVVGSVVDTLPRPALERIHELSGGNPMYAIELARAVDLFDDPLVASVPPTLRRTLLNRIDAVSPDVMTVLRTAAALGPASAQAIVGAVDGHDVPDLIGAAVTSGLLVVGDDLIVRFAHPLLASVVLEAIEPLDRQLLHARLAALADDSDARARHLALSCAEPDAVVALELEQAATRSSRRGASALAADFATHAVRVTPPAEVAPRIRRSFIAIMHRAAAGDKARALAECDQILALLPRGPARAEAMTLRVALDFANGDQFLEQALTEVGGDELLRGRVLELRGWMAVTYHAELTRGLELSEEALAIAERHADPTLEMLASSAVATASLMLGRPRDDLMTRALRLAETNVGPRLGRWPQGIYGRLGVWCGRLDVARPVLEALHDAFVRSGMEFQRPYRLLDLAELELACGHLALAADLAGEGIEAAVDAGNEQAAAWLGAPAGVANAHLGRTSRAAEAVESLLFGASEHEGRTRLIMAHHVLGVIALSNGDPAMAVAELEPGLALAREIGVRLPSVVPVLPEAIEAMALVGDAERCTELAAELDCQAAEVGQPWVDAAACRGRGLVAVASGGDDAADLLGEAAAMFDELGYGMDAARSVLLQGRALRRAGRRNASADVLAEAHCRFVAMGALPWLAQTEAELARVAPGRERAELTPTEGRIAALVAAGRRNREIAGELFVSVATVEAHLTRIYRKLHVRSRTELASVVQPDR